MKRVRWDDVRGSLSFAARLPGTLLLLIFEYGREDTRAGRGKRRRCRFRRRSIPPHCSGLLNSRLVRVLSGVYIHMLEGAPLTPLPPASHVCSCHVHAHVPCGLAWPVHAHAVGSLHARPSPHRPPSLQLRRVPRSRSQESVGARTLATILARNTRALRAQGWRRTAVLRCWSRVRCSCCRQVGSPCARSLLV